MRNRRIPKKKPQNYYQHLVLSLLTLQLIVTTILALRHVASVARIEAGQQEILTEVTANHAGLDRAAVQANELWMATNKLGEKIDAIALRQQINEANISFNREAADRIAKKLPTTQPVVLPDPLPLPPRK